MSEATELPANVQEILRRPFPPEQIGKLPRITCGDCRSAEGRVCGKHSKGRCNVCKQWITDSHIHLDYVGHAAVTDRLLQADPGWNWEPAYRDVDPMVMAAAAATGNPEVVAMVLANSPAKVDAQGGLWIKLTVAGITRLGYGTDDDRGPDHDKKLISDCLRNAAMRFGVAVDLWSKEDLGMGAAPASEPTGPDFRDPNRPFAESLPNGPGAVPRRDWITEAKACTDIATLLALGRECNDAGGFTGETKAAMLQRREELTAAAASR